VQGGFEVFFEPHLDLVLEAQVRAASHMFVQLCPVREDPTGRDVRLSRHGSAQGC
jgi:hypothetical protein